MTIDDGMSRSVSCVPEIVEGGEGERGGRGGGGGGRGGGRGGGERRKRGRERGREDTGKERGGRGGRERRGEGERREGELNKRSVAADSVQSEIRNSSCSEGRHNGCHGNEVAGVRHPWQ